MEGLMQFVIPVEMVGYNGERYRAAMGPFEHSPEREFSLTVNKKAIQDCSSLEQLKPVATNLLVGWSSMQTAVQSLMLENIQLRQALDKRTIDLQAAEEIINEAVEIIQQNQNQTTSQKQRSHSSVPEQNQQSPRARRSLWPW